MNTAEKEKIQKKLIEICKNEIRISYKKRDETLPACSSKIGGTPAVPSDFVWPQYTGEGYNNKIESRPLSFMAQINLKEAAQYDTEGILPKQGVLSFFYEQISMTWGFDPSNKGSAKVYYFPDEEKLHPIDTPENMDEEAVIPELEIIFEQHISIPDLQSFPHTGVDLEWDEYNECCCKCGYECDEWGDNTKLLGYPDVIQSPMEEECESVTRGYRRGCPEEYAKIPQSEKDDIKEKSKEWMLLFQMGTISTDDSEYMFGDCGHIYFWIRRSDLMKLNFDNVWLILQCY